MKQILFALLLIGSFQTLSAQGYINIVQESSIAFLIDKDKQLNKSKQFVSGYTIQIMASDSRSKVTSGKGQFISKFPGVKVDWDYENPYYKLRAGAFQTRLEAHQLLYKLRYAYPDAYIVKTNKLKPSDFL